MIKNGCHVRISKYLPVEPADETLGLIRPRGGKSQIIGKVSLFGTSDVHVFETDFVDDGSVNYETNLVN